MSPCLATGAHGIEGDLSGPRNSWNDKLATDDPLARDRLQPARPAGSSAQTLQCHRLPDFPVKVAAVPTGGPVNLGAARGRQAAPAAGCHAELFERRDQYLVERKQLEFFSPFATIVRSPFLKSFGTLMVKTPTGSQFRNASATLISRPGRLLWGQSVSSGSRYSGCSNRRGRIVPSAFCTSPQGQGDVAPRSGVGTSGSVPRAPVRSRQGWNVRGHQGRAAIRWALRPGMLAFSGFVSGCDRRRDHRGRSSRRELSLLYRPRPFRWPGFNHEFGHLVNWSLVTASGGRQ
jgi:hypothetical protein